MPTRFTVVPARFTMIMYTKMLSKRETLYMTTRQLVGKVAVNGQNILMKIRRHLTGLIL